jgi:hypothetical protein
MEAENLVSRTPQLTWNEAMDRVSKKFLKDQYAGSVESLNPLMAAGLSKNLAIDTKQKQVISSRRVKLRFLYVSCILCFLFYASCHVIGVLRPTSPGRSAWPLVHFLQFVLC